MNNKKWRSIWLSSIYVILFFLGTITQAQAVPSFARQTGMDCAACHTKFPELTPFGREFKLRGYTLGERQLLPLAAMMQFSMTSISKKNDNSGVKQIARQGDPQFDGLSVFAAGKISDYAGMFVQWTYTNNGAVRDDNSFIGHSNLDNTDLRVVGTRDLFGKDLVFGLNLNNNPSVQDVWNTSPAWGYPYNGSNLAPGPSYATVIDGGLSQQVAGVGAYFWWDRHLYGEFSFYGNADGPFRVLSAGQPAYRPIEGRNNPYWRLAWNQEWGAHSLMVGTFGMQVDKYLDNVNGTGPTDRFTDTALDAQYQYISDPGIFSVQTTYIHEKQDYTASFDPTCDPTAGACQNKSNILNTFKAKATYLYNRKYGATLGYFSTTGSSDNFLYGTVVDVNTGLPVSNKPDNRGYIAELDYNPWTNVRIALQYIAYTKWDGASSNIDGNGRSPHDNNTLFLNTWFAF